MKKIIINKDLKNNSSDEKISIHWVEVSDCGNKKRLLGTLTDGDIRRAILKGKN